MNKLINIIPIYIQINIKLTKNCKHKTITDATTSCIQTDTHVKLSSVTVKSYVHSFVFVSLLMALYEPKHVRRTVT
jgi:hypothetical protein